jgi:sugar phosphate isomerase/epimerase
LSCSSLAFEGVKWDEALDAIKGLGFQYAELGMLEGKGHVNPSSLSDPESHGKKIAAVAERLEIEPIAIHVDLALGDPRQFPGLTTPDAAARKAILAHFERVVAAARAAEIPLIIVAPGRPVESLSPDTCMKHACDVLTQMHAMVARRGLTLAIQNREDCIGQHPEETQQILEKVPGLRLDYRIAHIVSNEYSVERTAALVKYVAHVGVRNAKPGAVEHPLENGELSYSILPFLEMFKSKEVDAFVSVEHSRTSDRIEISRVKAILEEAGVTP